MQLSVSALKEEHIPSKEHAHVFHHLLRAIETVRITRQEEYREKHHPQLKRFTQQELNDEACPTYKNWLIGRSRRLPSRSLLMTIADYLECSLNERNNILLAAQYLPERPQWEGEELRQALEHARQVMEALPYPAIVVTNTFQVHAANELFLRFLELPSLDTLLPQQRSTMHLFFHPNCYERSMFNTEARTVRQEYLLHTIQHFKQQNVLSQYDVWYQQLVKQWCEFTDFQEHWEKAREVTGQEDAPPKMMLARMATTGELLPIRVRHMLVSINSKIYPAVSALLPVDEAARAVYGSLGSVISLPSSVG